VNERLGIDISKISTAEKIQCCVNINAWAQIISCHALEDVAGIIATRSVSFEVAHLSVA